MARRTATWTPQRVRERMKATQLMHRLHNHACGKLSTDSFYGDIERKHGVSRAVVDEILARTKMTTTQIKAAEVFLRKIIPDLRSVEHSGEIRHRVEELSDDELSAIAAGRSEGIAETPRGTTLN